MDQDPLPLNTLRDLATLLVVVAEVAWEGTRRTLRRVRPYIEPPPDLEVRSSRGAEYSGVLLIDGNDIVAGVVARTGQNEPSSPPAMHRTIRDPLGVIVPTEENHSRGDGYLRGWAEDARTEEEEDAWYPRTQRP